MDTKQRVRLEEQSKYTADYYKEHYWAEDLPGRSGNRGLSYDDPTHKLRFGFMADALMAHFEFHTFLDAGCGTGILAAVMGDRGKPATAFDVSSAAANLLHQAGRTSSCSFVQASIDEIPFKDRTFDLTFCSDVLEHVPAFDAAVAVGNLIRVTDKYLVATINLDNPYFFHPTILARETWHAHFMDGGELQHLSEVEAALQRMVQARYVEYDFFVYERV